jgi:hypothetical protein
MVWKEDGCNGVGGCRSVWRRVSSCFFCLTSTFSPCTHQCTQTQGASFDPHLVFFVFFQVRWDWRRRQTQATRQQKQCFDLSKVKEGNRFPLTHPSPVTGAHRAHRHASAHLPSHHVLLRSSSASDHSAPRRCSAARDSGSSASANRLQQCCPISRPPRAGTGQKAF